MITLKIDYENNAQPWWDALVEACRLRDRANPVPNALRRLAGSGPSTDEVTIDESEQEAILAFCESLPGWTGGPEYAPHPLCWVEA